MSRETYTGPNPYGFCFCGCGRKTPLAKKSSRRDQTAKGKPTRWITGHAPSALSVTGSAHPSWKGGSFVKEGRRMVTVGKDHPMADHQGYVAEYRLLLAAALGRMLLPSDHVHHLDLDESNDSIENLVVLTMAEHMRVHSLIRWRGLLALEAMRSVMENQLT